MKQLVDQGIVSSYGPLVDKKGSYVAQWEHVRRPSPFRWTLELTLVLRQFSSTAVGKKSLVVAKTTDCNISDGLFHYSIAAASMGSFAYHICLPFVLKFGCHA